MVIITGQLFRQKWPGSHFFPACLDFSLPKGHFLGSQRNSADCISRWATFQGVGGSHTWADRDVEQHAPRSDGRYLLCKQHRVSGSWRAATRFINPILLLRFREGAEGLSEPLSHPTSSGSLPSYFHLLTPVPYFWRNNYQRKLYPRRGIHLSNRCLYLQKRGPLKEQRLQDKTL